MTLRGDLNKTRDLFLESGLSRKVSKLEVSRSMTTQVIFELHRAPDYGASMDYVWWT
jgi:hypothetical protein